MHLKRVMRTGSTDGRVRQSPVCTIDDCEEPSRSRNLCSKHYQATFRADYVSPATCSVEGCEGHVHGHGLCNRHRLRLKRAGTLDLPQREVQPCSLEGCDRPSKTKRLCDLHYKRLLRTGSTELVERVRVERPHVERKPRQHGERTPKVERTPRQRVALIEQRDGEWIVGRPGREHAYDDTRGYNFEDEAQLIRKQLASVGIRSEVSHGDTLMEIRGELRIVSAWRCLITEVAHA